MKEIKKKKKNWKINVSLAVVALLMLPGSSMLIDNSMPTDRDISEMSIDNGAFGGITIYVDDSNTAGPWDGTIDYPYQYIQDGIGAASDGDTIVVYDGDYSENLVVDKGVSLQTEASSVFVVGEHMITADNVSISGFTFNNSAGYTITIDSSTGNRNNTLITQCTFNLVGWSGVHLGGDVGGNKISSVEISYSTFNGPSNHLSNPFKIGGFFGSPSSVEINGIEFIHNTVNNGSIPINLQDGNINGITIAHNTFRDTDGVVYLWGEGTPSGVLSNFIFKNNTVDATNSYGVGFDLESNPVFSDVNYGTGNLITYNTFNGIMGAYGFEAVSILSPLTEYTLNATCNYWGDATGANHTSNPHGTGQGGDTVSANVDFIPWYATGTTTPETQYVSVDHPTISIIAYSDTIQDGIDAAIDGDTIIVNDGIYNENILVNKELTIKASSSPVIDGQGMFGPAINIQADNVILQGFIIKNFAATPTAYIGAILVEGDNTTIDSNTIENITSAEASPAGIGIDVHAKDVQITNNTVRDVGSIGIRVRHDWNTPPTESNNVLIENNTVCRTNNTGVLVTGYARGITIRNNVIYDSLMPTPYNLFVHYGAENVTIEYNYIHNTYSNVVFAGCNNITISNNTIADTIADPSPGKNIYILSDYGNWTGDVNLLSTNVDIINNDIMNGSYGIRIMNAGATDPSQMASTTTINSNNIYDNTDYGVENMIGTNVNAAYNWWGNTSGPYHATSNPTGQGDNVSDNVDFIPWLDAPEGNPTSNPPEISDVYATPASQIAGGYVNITCNVVDDLAVDTVKVNITGPDGYSPVNATMNGGIPYYYNSTYSIIGTYHYFIWANDTTGMTNTSPLYVFDITEVPDTEVPVITDVSAAPIPQIADRFVNITCNVTDNRRISAVNVNVTYPDTSIVNQTMTYNETTNTAFFNSTYSLCGTYLFFIWANDTSGNTNISALYTFEIINHPPYKPSDPYPVDQAIEIDINADLSWTGGDPDGHPVTYDIYFDTLHPPAKVISNHSDTTYDPGPMDHIRRYYWQIVAWDNHGASTEGDIWEFTTSLPNRPPYIPYDPIPKNHATNISINTSLKWSGGDPDIGDIVTYDVYLGIITPPPLVAVDVNITTYKPKNLMYNQLYHWRIVAWDNHGASTGSSIWDFTTMHSPNMPPDKPTNPIPPDNATNVELNPLLSVYVTDPQNNPMDVSFYDALDNSLIGADNNVASGSRATFPWYGLEFNATYYWYAVADDGEYTTQSDTWCFTTTIYNRPPDTPATPSGPTLVRTGVEYTYNSSTIDPDGNRIFYNFSWGDGTCSGWIGPLNSSENVSASHTWTEVREYEVKVKAKDTYGEESKWSYPLMVSGTKAATINNLQIGHVYLFNFGYAYLYPLAYLGAVVVITRRADLYVNVTATIDVEKVKFIATDIIFGGQTILWDNNTMDGCCCFFNISGGMYNITVYAYDEEGKEVGSDSIRSLFYINFRRFPTKST